MFLVWADSGHTQLKRLIDISMKGGGVQVVHSTKVDIVIVFHCIQYMFFTNEIVFVPEKICGGRWEYSAPMDAIPVQIIMVGINRKQFFQDIFLRIVHSTSQSRKSFKIYELYNRFRCMTRKSPVGSQRKKSKPDPIIVLASSCLENNSNI